MLFDLISFSELPKLSILLAGIIGGILPDIFVNVIKPPGSDMLRWLHPFRKKPLGQKIARFLIEHDHLHEKIHFFFNKKLSSKIGIVFQLMLSLFFVYQIVVSR